MFLIKNSENRKLGDMACTYLPIKHTCPSSCPLKDKGCYGQLSYVGMTNSRLESQTSHMKAYDIVRKEAREIAAFGPKAKGKTLRLHVSGDVRTSKAASLLRSCS